MIQDALDCLDAPAAPIQKRSIYKTARGHFPPVNSAHGSEGIVMPRAGCEKKRIDSEVLIMKLTDNLEKQAESAAVKEKRARPSGKPSCSSMIMSWKRYRAVGRIFSSIKCA